MHYELCEDFNDAGLAGTIGLVGINGAELMEIPGGEVVVVFLGGGGGGGGGEETVLLTIVGAKATSWGVVGTKAAR